MRAAVRGDRHGFGRVALLSGARRGTVSTASHASPVNRHRRSSGLPIILDLGATPPWPHVADVLEGPVITTHWKGGC